MEIYENILGNLTPSELDELAPADFNAKAPRGALKRIEKTAVEKTGIRAKRRKTHLKPLIIAAAAVVASTATLFTVNASMEGNLVRFFVGGKEVEGSHRDYVDHDGYRHVTFEAVVPLEFNNYALIVDVDADNDEFVRVFTEDTDPEFMNKLRQYHAANEDWGRKISEVYDKVCTWKGVDYKTINNFSVLEQIYDEAVAAGAFDPSERPKYIEPEDFGIVLTDSEELIWEFYETYTDSNGVEMCHGNSGSYSGKFKYSKAPGRKNYSSIGAKNHDYENNTKTIVISYVFYVGKDYVKESGKEVEGSYRDYVDHDGYRNVSFKATIPYSEEYYVVIFDVEAETTEEAVRVITSYSDPDFIDGLRQYRAAEDKASDDAKELWDRIYAWKGRNMRDDDADERDRVRQEALEAGVFTPDEWPKLPKPEDYGIVLKDNELLCYHVNFYYDDEYRGFGGDGYLGGEFMFLGEADGHPSGCGPRNKENDDDDGTIDYENETLTRTFSFFYYVGKD